MWWADGTGRTGWTLWELFCTAFCKLSWIVADDKWQFVFASKVYIWHFWVNSKKTQIHKRWTIEHWSSVNSRENIYSCIELDLTNDEVLYNHWQCVFIWASFPLGVQFGFVHYSLEPYPLFCLAFPLPTVPLLGRWAGFILDAYMLWCRSAP